MLFNWSAFVVSTFFDLYSAKRLRPLVVLLQSKPKEQPIWKTKNSS